MHTLLKLIATAFISAATVFHSSAQQPQGELVSKEDVLKAIERFRADPESEQGMVAAEVIVRFAKLSKDVQVTASPRMLPWMAVQPMPAQSKTLLSAYVAGSVRSQLESGQAKNDALAGEEQVIETYQKLQQATPDLRIPVVEHFVQLKKDGKLKEYLESSTSILP